jgi:hypothetical protein
VVTQPGYSSTVPAQATPDSIAATANNFIGLTWNDNGCWVLASAIAADAGAGLPMQSTLTNMAGAANGEWIVAFDGPAGQTGDWQSMVTTGEIVVFQTTSGTGHVTTCVSGSGSAAMVVDNATFVNGSGQVTNAANDGSSSDIVIQGPHAASQEFAGVATSSVVIYELDTPVVTATVSSVSLVAAASQSLGALFTASDPANNAITEWQVYNTASTDSLVLGGADYSDLSASDALSASALSAISLLAGSVSTTDTLEVRAYNGAYWGDWASLAVTVAGSASPPVLVAQTPNQSWTEGTRYTLALPASTFSDPQNESLTYSAALSNGHSLPSWLTFNAANDSFSGTAPGSAQTVTVAVTATDTSGLSVSETFTIAVVVSAPVLANPTANQTWKEGQSISLRLASNTFTDPSGERMTYSATLSNGQALPSWLKFNASSDSFSGTPPNTAQTLDITVTATDTGGGTTSETFAATVLGTPVVTAQTASQTWTENNTVSFTLPANTFTDPQGESLTYQATQQNGQALPSWLKFNAATETFSGTAPKSAQTVDIKVTATDSSGLSTSETFAASVAAATNNTRNTGHAGGVTVTEPTANYTWTDGSNVNLALPANTFTDALGLNMSFAAYQVSGADVMSWLHFNAATDRFYGSVPKGASGTVELAVIATDTQQLTAEDMFSVTFAPSFGGHNGSIVSAAGMLLQPDPSSTALMLALPN